MCELMNSMLYFYDSVTGNVVVITFMIYCALRLNIPAGYMFLDCFTQNQVLLVVCRLSRIYIKLLIIIILWKDS